MTIFSLTPMAGVRLHEINGKTPLSRVAGKITINCDHCGMAFSRQPCQLRGARRLCSRACFDAIRRVSVTKTCIICGREMTYRKSSAEAIVSCKHCRSVRKAHDAALRATRVDGLTILQICAKYQLSRTAVTYRLAHGLPMEPRPTRGRKPGATA